MRFGGIGAVVVRVDRAHLVQRAELLTSCLVRNIEVEVGKVAVVDGSQIADAAEAIILRYANDSIIARDLFVAVRKHQAGAVRDKVAGLSKEGESIAL